VEKLQNEEHRNLYSSPSRRCGYEVTGMISFFLQDSYLYTYSLQRGVTFKVLPLSSYVLSSTMLPLLETFMELLLWKSFLCRRHVSLNVFIVLKFSSLNSTLYFENGHKIFRAKSGE